MYAGGKDRTRSVGGSDLSDWPKTHPAAIFRVGHPIFKALELILATFAPLFFCLFETRAKARAPACCPGCCLELSSLLPPLPHGPILDFVVHRKANSTQPLICGSSGGLVGTSIFQGGRPVRIPDPPPPPPLQTLPKFSNPSFSNLRFWGKESAPKVPKFFFALHEGVYFFVYPMCLHSKYSEFGG